LAANAWKPRASAAQYAIAHSRWAGTILPARNRILDRMRGALARALGLERVELGERALELRDRT